MSPADLCPGAPAAHDDALIRAIARRTSAKIIFELGPSDSANAEHLALELGDETLVVAAGRDVPGAKAARSELANILKPEAVAKAEAVKHVDRLHGEGAHLEFAPWLGECDLVLTDASRPYEDLKCDSLTALHLVKPGGMIVWRNYRAESDVPRCLDTLYRTDERLRGLRYIAGTTLCIWERAAAE